MRILLILMIGVWLNASVYKEETPICEFGELNSNGICINEVSCANSDANKNGQCVGEKLSEEFNLYSLDVKTDNNCSIIGYQTIEKIPSKISFLERNEEHLIVDKIRNISEVASISVDESYPASWSCPSDYILGGITNNFLKCEKSIPTNCPTGQTWNSALKICEGWNDGILVPGNTQVIDYTNKETTTNNQQVAIYGTKTFSVIPCAQCDASQASFVNPSVQINNGEPECFKKFRTSGYCSNVTDLNNTSGWEQIGQIRFVSPQDIRIIGIFKKVTNSNYQVTQCPTGYTETVGAETSKGGCKKTITYPYYKYTCPTGYEPPINPGQTTVPVRTDSNGTTINNELSNPYNSSTLPTNNCYTKTTPTCSQGGTLTANSCELSSNLKCPSGGILNGTTCKVSTEDKCPDGYLLSNGSCTKETLSCPAGFKESSLSSCSKSTYSCPTGTEEYNTQCKKEVKAHCPTGYKEVNNKCQKEIINPNCNSIGKTTKEEITCPDFSYPKNGKCITDKSVVCEVGYQYNFITKQCESNGYCPAGYIDLENKGCRFDYSYSLYSCKQGWEGPLDTGLDCGGSQKECNSSVPPANNCKKPLTGDLSGNFEVNKYREIVSYEIIGSIVKKEYGIEKGFNSGEDSKFGITKIEGKGDELCFTSRNTPDIECIKVENCSFSGTLENKIYPYLIKEINVKNQNQLSMVLDNPIPSLENGVPTCFNGYIWDENSKICKESSNMEQIITSTCKMNGHVGWHSRQEGIISGITKLESKDRLDFWDSYTDKNLGFIEFIKDVKAEDRQDGFMPTNNLLYEMLSVGFTASDIVDNNTLFSSSETMSNEQCSSLAAKFKMPKSTAISDKTEEMMKILSGNRYKVLKNKPNCLEGTYDEELNTCIKSISNTCVGGKYDDINGYTWDNQQGNKITLYAAVYIPYSGIYKLSTETKGVASFYINKEGEDIMFSSLTINGALNMSYKEDNKEIFLKAGLNEIVVKASTEATIAQESFDNIKHGERGFKFYIIDKDNNEITNSKNWCKQESVINEQCAATRIKYSNLCLKEGLMYCTAGTYDKENLACNIESKCVLSKAGEMTYREQIEAIKVETRELKNQTFKCSPLKCVNNYCQTATCPPGNPPFEGHIIGAGMTPIKAEECIGNTCDANKPYYEYCGRKAGCPQGNPMIFEDEAGNCKEMYCPNGQIFDSSTMKCKKLECPENAVLQPDGSCKRK